MVQETFFLPRTFLAIAAGYQYSCSPLTAASYRSQRLGGRRDFATSSVDSRVSTAEEVRSMANSWGAPPTAAMRLCARQQALDNIAFRSLYPLSGYLSTSGCRLIWR